MSLGVIVLVLNLLGGRRVFNYSHRSPFRSTWL